MSKGSGSNSEAIKLQRDSLAESKIQNRAILALMQQEVNTAKTMKLPKLAPPMPLPDMSTGDAIAQSQETRRNLMKRSGLTQTVVAPVAPLKTAMGTPMFGLAA